MAQLFEAVVDGPQAYVAEPCVPEDPTTVRLTSAAGVEYVRTPDQAFDNMAAVGYPWAPHYVTLPTDGLRMHYLDEGGSGEDDAKEVIVLLHGEPTWSFLYRKMIPVLVQRGLRVIAPDWIGMGKSDKPTLMSEHTYANQLRRLEEFLQEVLSVDSNTSPVVNLFVQDWGSLVGLRVAGDDLSWFRRIIVGNGFLPVNDGNSPITIADNGVVNMNCSDTRTLLEAMVERVSSQPCGVDVSCFGVWANYALSGWNWNASDIVRLSSSTPLSEAEFAAYDAPYPTFTYRSGIRAFPSQMASAHEPEFGNTAAWENLGTFERPFLSLAGELDANLGSPEVQAGFINHIPGAQVHDFEHRRYANANHFIQEDVGDEMAEYMADFIFGTPLTATSATTVAPSAAETIITTAAPTPLTSSASASFLANNTSWCCLLLAAWFFRRH